MVTDWAYASIINPRVIAVGGESDQHHGCYDDGSRSLLEGKEPLSDYIDAVAVYNNGASRPFTITGKDYNNNDTDNKDNNNNINNNNNIYLEP